MFDSDGTLADTLPFMRVLFNRLADKYHFRKVEDHEADAFRDSNMREMLRATGIPLWKAPRIAADMRKLVAQHIDQFSPFAGVAEMLQALSEAGATLAIVSSNSEENVRSILGAESAARISHFACGVSLFGKAAKLSGVVRASGIPATETIYIGDELRDGEAARKARVAFGAVGWGQCRLETLRRAGVDEFFSSVTEIAEKLLAKR